ncbi:MAG: hypothetical protein D6830_04290 [Ignavibacteria bacterium]|nr:MAG: hypothetical protein D6830_04290 [Ignavibacteria bacterium]
MAGDVTSNEVFLSKIIFEEMYDVQLNISLDTKTPEIDSKNYLIVGNSNFDKDLFRKGISFAEQLAEFFDYPYVNFVVASKSEDVIKELNDKFQKIDENIEDKLNTILDNLNISEDSRNFIKSNFNQVYFEITPNEETALNEMLKYPFYKGIVKDMIDLKFV